MRRVGSWGALGGYEGARMLKCHGPGSKGQATGAATGEQGMPPPRQMLSQDIAALCLQMPLTGGKKQAGPLQLLKSCAGH